MDTILFSLLILRGLFDSQGRVWRCHPSQLYAIEITSPNMHFQLSSEEALALPESRTLAFLSLLPAVTCLSPADTLKQQSGKSIGEFMHNPYKRYTVVEFYAAMHGVVTTLAHSPACNGSK